MTHQAHKYPCNESPHILICTRFGLRVRDPAWLAHRLVLISSITAPSLLAQSDQSFHWAVLIDDGLPEAIEAELERVLEPFGKRAFLYRQPFHTADTFVRLARDREISEAGSYLLTARIDDDDAWSVRMVGEVRRRIARWLEQPGHAPGLSLTFQDGLEWIMHPLLDVGQALSTGERYMHAPEIRNCRMPFIGMSVFVCSLLSDGATAMSGEHSGVAQRLRETKGFATDIVSTESPMWLYCRHKQSGTGIRKAEGPGVSLTVSELSLQFGLDERKVQNYLDHADDHQYALVRNPVATKHKLFAELFRINEEIRAPAVGSDRLTELRQRKEVLAAEIAQLEVDVLGDPEALLLEETSN